MSKTRAAAIAALAAMMRVACRAAVAALACATLAAGPAVAQSDAELRERQRADQEKGPRPPPRVPPALLRTPCASAPRCSQRSAAFCTQRGVCRRGGRPERGCLQYSCIGNLQNVPPHIRTRPPVFKRRPVLVAPTRQR